MIRHAIYEQIEKLQRPVVCPECHAIFEAGTDCCPACHAKNCVMCAPVAAENRVCNECETELSALPESEILEALHYVRVP